MKNIIYTYIVAFFLTLMSCGRKINKSTPSIKDNSNRNKEVSNIDYSNVKPEKLLKQVKAHYDLDEFSTAKEKLTYLMSQFQGSFAVEDLEDLKQKIDLKLAEELAKKNEIAKLERSSRLSFALDKMNIIEKDDFIIYRDKSSPEFDTNECFYAYVKKDVYGYKLYFRIRYINTQWLNINSYIITIDGLDKTLEGEVQKTETRGKKKYKVELLDKQVVSKEDLEVLNSIASGENVLALYVGDNAYKKREISQKQRHAVRNVLDVYEYFNTKKKIKIESNITDKN